MQPPTPPLPPLPPTDLLVTRRVSVTFTMKHRIKQIKCSSLREKCSYLEFFWSVFSHIRTEYGEIRTKNIPNIQTLFTQCILRYTQGWDYLSFYICFNNLIFVYNVQIKYIFIYLKWNQVFKKTTGYKSAFRKKRPCETSNRSFLRK